ncbi:MAG: ABC transporter permease [bacterium]
MNRPAWLELPPLSPLLRRRILTALPTLFVVVTLTFLLVRAAPGGPFRSERAVPEAVRENMEARYGLDRPLPLQYMRFWGNVLTGRLGPSFQHPERTAAGVLWDGAGPSLVLGVSALLIALLLGMGGGTAAAVWPRGQPWISAAALAALAVPVFVLGPLFIRVFAVGLGWLPAGLWGRPEHLVLPALTLGIPVGGAAARFWRAALEEELDTPACLAARARGLGSLKTVWKHAAPRSLPLLLNYLGPLAAGLVTGSVVVEKVFGIPGMGRYFVDSALARDYPVVIGATLAYAVMLLAVHTAADLAHLRLDPRLRKEHADWMGMQEERRGDPDL